MRYTRGSNIDVYVSITDVSECTRLAIHYTLSRYSISVLYNVSNFNNMLYHNIPSN